MTVDPYAHGRPPAIYEEGVIDLRAILVAIARNWWLIGLSILVAALGAVVIAFRLPDQFEAKTSLLIAARVSGLIFAESPSQGTSQSISVPAGADLSDEAFQTIALSSNILESVINELDLRDESTGEPWPVSRLAKTMLLTLERADRDSRTAPLLLVTLRVSGAEPTLVQGIANTWAQIFVRENRELFLSEVARSHDRLESQVEALRADLRIVGQDQLDHLAENPIDLMNTRLIVVTSQYRMTVSRLLEKEAALVSGQSRMAALEQALAKEPPYLVLKRSISNDSLARFLADGVSPDDIEALEGLQIQAEELNSVHFSLLSQLRGTETEVMTLTEEVRDLSERAGAYDAEIQQLSTDIAKALATREEIDRESAGLTTQLNQVSIRLREAQLAQAEEGGVIRVVQRAILPTEAVGPVRSQNIIVGLVVGLLLGLGAVWVRQTLQNPGAVQRKASLEEVIAGADR